MAEAGYRQAAPRYAPVWSWRGDDRAVADHVARHVPLDRASFLAFAGGSTPKPILDRLRDYSLPWHRATIVPTDERLVAPTHWASNYGMLSRALDRTPAWISPLDEIALPERFDLVWLGMAEDGKIASLFSSADVERRPTQPAADPKLVRTRPADRSGHVAVDRLSLSLDAIADAGEIILVIRGHRKRALAERAAEGAVDIPLTHLFAAARSPVRIFWSAC
jgi:6-phosphogluconolactonase